MCGRARLATDVTDLAIVFDVAAAHPLPNVPPSWNLAPTDNLAIVRHHPVARERRLDLARWGLVPSWAKDIKIGFSTFNARAETIDAAPAFREAFRRRRCLIPLDGFYEWQKLGPKERQPYAIGLRTGLMALAGLWEIWKSPQGETVRSATIVTCPANPLLAPLHERMPVILAPETWPQWLGEAAVAAADLAGLLAPYPAEQMTLWPVDQRVGNVRNNDPGLAEPLR